MFQAAEGFLRSKLLLYDELEQPGIKNFTLKTLKNHFDSRFNRKIDKETFEKVSKYRIQTPVRKQSLNISRPRYYQHLKFDLTLETFKIKP